VAGRKDVSCIWDILREFLHDNFVSGLRTSKPKNLKSLKLISKKLVFSSPAPHALTHTTKPTSSSAIAERPRCRVG